jgi:hypothetical protein
VLIRIVDTSATSLAAAGGQSRAASCQPRSARHPADMAQSTIETTTASRAHPAGGRRKLPPMPGNPRKTAAEMPVLAGDPRRFPLNPQAQ